MALPAISCEDDFPADQAALVAIYICKANRQTMKRIEICLLPEEEEAFQTYISQAREILKVPGKISIGL